MQLSMLGSISQSCWVKIMGKILDALLKTYDGVENVVVIHAAFDEAPHTVALV